MTDQVQDQATETATPSVELTLNDLGQLAAVIDLATQRGAFKAAELTAVGAAYDKLSGFLSAVAQQTAGAEEVAESATEEAAA